VLAVDPVRGEIDDIAVLGEPFAQVARELGLILDDENSDVVPR
jgi:hypothetical protein